MRKENAITLVSLIITIVVLLILAMVSVSLVINRGILDKTKNAVDKYSEEEIGEQIKLAYLECETEKFYNSNIDKEEILTNRLGNIYGEENIKNLSINTGIIIVTINNKTYKYNSDTGITTQLKFISKSIEENFIGYYADIEGDGKVDGIIFADLLTGSIKNVQNWGIYNQGPYEINKLNKDIVNDYYISEEEYEWQDIKKPVLSQIKNGTDRFYIMSLDDFTTTSYTNFYWYKNAAGYMNDYNTATSVDFGTGNKNTKDMIKRWNLGKVSDGGYGEQNDQDIWQYIQTLSENGWFIPSRGEWSAFANEIGINAVNYKSVYKLGGNYLSSSQSGTYYAWCAEFSGNKINGIGVDKIVLVRLATTF